MGADIILRELSQMQYVLIVVRQMRRCARTRYTRGILLTLQYRDIEDECTLRGLVSDEQGRTPVLDIPSRAVYVFYSFALLYTSPIEE